MAPGRVAGCSGTRNLQDNLSDLRAQVAANQKGIQLVAELIGLYGLGVVQAYMGHIQVGPAPPPRAAAATPLLTLSPSPGQRGAGRARDAEGLRRPLGRSRGG